jgi:hypothetical protein
MRKGFLGALLLWLAGGGWALAQSFGPVPTYITPPPPPLDNAFDESTPPLPPNAFADSCECPRCNKAFWITAEYLLWWLKASSSPPLLTGGEMSSLGILGQQGTAILYETSNPGINSFNGARIAMGGSFGPNYALSAEANVFGLDSATHTFSAGSDANGSPFLSRPIINANTGEESVLFVAFPTQFAGGITFTTKTEFYGAEANVGLDVSRLCCKYSGPQLLFGARYLNLYDTLDIFQKSQLLANGISGFNGDVIRIPDVLSINDNFSARNQFLGGQVGVRVEYGWGRIFTNVVGKVAYGPNFETLNLTGSTTRTTIGGGQVTVPGGLLVQTSNGGQFNHTEWTIVPEVNITVGVHITDCLHVFVGYNFLYWADVTQSGHAIDRAITPGLLPTSVQFGSGGPQRPATMFGQTDFWAQGLNVGVAFVF